jgi:tripartite-type tricarboxylate transporter receptor subunit TctC
LAVLRRHKTGILTGGDMTPTRSRSIAWACALYLLAAGAAAQETQDYPSRPVKLILATAPGGAIDVQTRLFAQKLTDAMGRPFIIEYKPGGSNRIGYQYAAKSAPDGYSLLLVNPTFTFSPFLGGNAGYDPIRDFTPISQVAKGPYVLVVNPAQPFRSLRDYLDYARANPGKIDVGTVGDGSFYHLAFAWLHNETKVQVNYVPYKGGAPALLDVLGGQLSASLGSPLSTLGHIKSGKVRAIAVTTAERSSILPDVPTVAEQGVPGYDLSTWLGFVAPARTPAPIIARLNAELVKAAKDPKIVQVLETDGAYPVGTSIEQFRQVINTEVSRWGKVIKEAGIVLKD